ncbi:MAG: hypothetical protein R3B82_00490 [Sandaracinaceae bacterium]
MRRAIFGALAFVLAGCSLVNAPSDHLPGPVAADDFCAEYAALMCDGVLGCCPGAAGTPREDCVSILGAVCAMGLSSLTSDSRTGYDAEEAGYQLAYARDLVNRCDPGIAAWQNRFDGLVGALRGTVPEGELCNPIFAESFLERRIDTPRFYSCEGDLACRPTTSLAEWRCLDRGVPGSACTGFGDCEEGLVCRVISGTETACSERFPDGASCVADAQCESYACATCVGDACTCTPDDTVEQVYCALLR